MEKEDKKFQWLEWFDVVFTKPKKDVAESVRESFAKDLKEILENHKKESNNGK